MGTWALGRPVHVIGCGTSRCRGALQRPSNATSGDCLLVIFVGSKRTKSGCQQLNMTENKNAGRCLGSPVSALSQPPAVAVATRDQAAYLGSTYIN